MINLELTKEQIGLILYFIDEYQGKIALNIDNRLTNILGEPVKIDDLPQEIQNLADYLYNEIISN
ncbi:hypothetical protein [Gloeothece verrucosa]|uniref:Flagellar protein FliS n=1 Tax=Gloeothece verrucosa (strain PCC 7822) TaxID=497965 RepID=E0UME5_GLOV7|nr:hypothetical protein [Gloeothece verrucosa]ADN18125.1 flagellar protein FliS [Gloeothece verrucosa PCC 7822]